ncbi:MAG: type II toxin-antitoxin system death-on-curing family toxin [Bryobacterales bacterium]|nr:type II toxin-antitoxin system death-on-curing family toxin [Bryobacterales bacterium]
METAPAIALKPAFFTLKEVMDIHEEMVRRYGGKRGIRDSALLESSLTMPRTGIVGQYLHNDLFEMAAAYLFHFSRNRPFYSANDRTAVTAALVFLRVNGYEAHGPARELHDLVNAVVQQKADKEIIAWFFRTHSKPLVASAAAEGAEEPASPSADG